MTEKQIYSYDRNDDELTLTYLPEVDKLRIDAWSTRDDVFGTCFRISRQEAEKLHRQLGAFLRNLEKEE